VSQANKSNAASAFGARKVRLAPEGFAISPKGDLAFAILLAGNSDKKAWFSRKAGSAVVLVVGDGV
jgi:hypothetical protein